MLHSLPLTRLDLDQILSEALQQQQNQQATDYKIYTEYQDDPVGFCENVLGEKFAPDIENVMESVRDFVYTVARSANAVGKTHSAARIAIWFYKCFPGSQIYTTAASPFSNLQKLLWGEIGAVVRKNQSLFDKDSVITLNIGRSSNEFITGVTIPSSGAEEEREARFSGKHAPYLMFILDEADAIPAPVFKGIESCISGGHVRVLAMFNPRRKAGRVYQMEIAGDANVCELSALNHPNVLTGKNLFPGAVTRDRTLQRINAWTRPLHPGEDSDREIFQVPDFLVGLECTNDKGMPMPPLPPGKRKIITPQFYYMVCAQYPPQAEAQLISEEWYYNARSRYDAYISQFGAKPPAGVKAKLGVDVAEMGDDLSVACLRFGGWVPPLQSWNGVDTLVTGDRCAQIVRGNLVDSVFVDATGLGAGVAPHIRRSLQRSPVTRYAFNTSAIYGIMVGEGSDLYAYDEMGIKLGEFKILRDQLWWATREWLRTDPGAMLPPSDELRDELLAPTYEVDLKHVRVQQKDKIKAELGRSPNYADALCMTFAPARTFRMGLV